MRPRPKMPRTEPSSALPRIKLGCQFRGHFPLNIKNKYLLRKTYFPVTNFFASLIASGIRRLTESSRATQSLAVASVRQEPANPTAIPLKVGQIFRKIYDGFRLPPCTFRRINVVITSRDCHLQQL